MPATVTVSVKIGPEEVEASPYSIWKKPLSLELVFDPDALYFRFLWQASTVQLEFGTQRSAEPAKGYNNEFDRQLFEATDESREPLGGGKREDNSLSKLIKNF